MKRSLIAKLSEIWNGTEICHQVLFMDIKITSHTHLMPVEITRKPPVAAIFTRLIANRRASYST